MIEVAIKSVEAVFDWKQFLMDSFGYDVDGELNDYEASSKKQSKREATRELYERKREETRELTREMQVRERSRKRDD